MMTLPPSDRNQVDNQGFVLIEVDDIFEAGDGRRRKLVEHFCERCQCGKRKRLIDLGDEGTLISGKRDIQKQDKSFVWHMDEYAVGIKPISVPRGYISSTTEIGDDILSRVVALTARLDGSVETVGPMLPQAIQ